MLNGNNLGENMKYNIMELIFKRLLKIDADFKTKAEIVNRQLSGKKTPGAGPAWWAGPVPPEIIQKSSEKDKEA